MKNAYKVFYCLSLLMLFIGINYFIQNYFRPTFVIIILYLSALPLYRLINKWFQNTRLSSIVSLTIINSSLIIIFSYLGTYLVDMVIKVYFLNRRSYSSFLRDILKALNIDFYNLLDYVNRFTSPLFLKGALATGEIIIVFFISNIIVYFLLSDKSSIKSFIRLFIKDNYLHRLQSSISNLNRLFTLELILALLSTLFTLMGFIILKINDALILSILCGILDILPYVGTVIVFIPLVIYNIIKKDYYIAIGLICLYLLVSIVRRILEAKYLVNSFSIHPLFIVLSLYIGIQLFGIFGLFIGPLYVIMAKEIILN